LTSQSLGLYAVIGNAQILRLPQRHRHFASRQLCCPRPGAIQQRTDPHSCPLDSLT
jgi:hypothetical protein